MNFIEKLDEALRPLDQEPIIQVSIDANNIMQMTELSEGEVRYWMARHKAGLEHVMMNAALAYIKRNPSL